MPINGQGELFTRLETSLTTNVGSDYVSGIQVLRRDGATTSQGFSNNFIMNLICQYIN